MIILVPLVVFLSTYINQSMEDEDKVKYYVALGVFILILLLPKFIPFIIQAINV